MAIQALDAPAGNRVGELCRVARLRPAWIEHLELIDVLPLDYRRELAAHGLDLGQLRHRSPSGRRARGRGQTRERQREVLRARRPMLLRAGPRVRLEVDVAQPLA